MSLKTPYLIATLMLIGIAYCSEAQAGHWHHRHDRWGSGGGGGSAGGSSGGYGSTGGSSGGSSGGYGSAGGAGAQLTLPAGSTDALLSVLVPTEAQVVVNGVALTTGGTRRTYIANKLPAGQTKYNVRAIFLRDGLPATDAEKDVYLQPGAIEEIDLRGTPGLSGSVVFGPDAIVGATVQLSGPKSRKVRTDDNGRFEFRSLPPGQYELKVDGNALNVSREAVQPVIIPAELPEDTPLVVQVALP